MEHRPEQPWAGYALLAYSRVWYSGARIPQLECLREKVVGTVERARVLAHLGERSGPVISTVIHMVTEAVDLIVCMSSKT